MIINKNKLNTILKKSKYSIKIDKEILKTGDNWEVNIKGTIKGITMSSKMPKWFKIWNEKEFTPLKKDVIELKKDVAKLKKDVAKLKKDVIEIKKDIFVMKNTPTMKRELVNL